ncbi:TPA: hypothetical protein EYG59_27840 [Candidatus Poribacteria bacterium]|nr:hypothetical protein [Candidatus Poribacteria bacterium]HIO82395.1 hypothetical protein [Candidatus Poribacteria bacterium]
MEKSYLLSCQQQPRKPPQILAGRQIDVVISVRDNLNEPVITKRPLKIQAFDTRYPENTVLIPVGEFEMGVDTDQTSQLL